MILIYVLFSDHQPELYVEDCSSKDFGSGLPLEK